MAENPSLGGGIALQYKMPQSDFAAQAIMKRRKEEDDAFKAAQAAMAARQKDREKYAGEQNKWIVDSQKGIWKGYYPDITAKTSKLTEYMQQNPDKNFAVDPTFNALKSELQQTFDARQQDTKKLNEDMELRGKNPNLFQGNSKVDATGRKVGDKYNEAISSGDIDMLIEANRDVHGQYATDSYTFGMNEAIDKNDYLEQMQKNVVGSGLRYKSAIDPETGASKGLIAPKMEQIEEQYTVSAKQPWHDKMLAQYTSSGLSIPDAEAQIKKSWINSIPKDVTTFSASKETDGDIDVKKTHKFSSPTVVKSEGDIYHGAGQDYVQVTLSKPKGGSLASNTYKTKDMQDVTGVATGEFLKTVKGGKPTMIIQVPTKQLPNPPGWADMEDDEREGWIQEQFKLNPDKFKSVVIPLDVDFNKNKASASFGYTEEIFNEQKSGGEDKYLGEKDIPGKGKRKVYQRADGSKYAK
jgi:hypothetical protein